MAVKKKSVRQASKRSPSKTVTRKKKSTPPSRPRPARSTTLPVKSLDELTERIDIMLPEVMFRLAALEHLLVKNQLCSYEELVNARQFIQDQEGI